MKPAARSEDVPNKLPTMTRTQQANLTAHSNFECSRAGADRTIRSGVFPGMWNANKIGKLVKASAIARIPDFIEHWLLTSVIMARSHTPPNVKLTEGGLSATCELANGVPGVSFGAARGSPF